MKTALRLSFLIAVLVLLADLSHGQGRGRWREYRHEAAIGVGTSSFMRNVDGIRPEGALPTTWDDLIYRPNISFNYRYYLKEKIALKGTYTRQSNRVNGKTRESNAERTSSFFDYITFLDQFQAMGEYHLFSEKFTSVFKKSSKVKLRGGRGGGSKTFGLYGGLGIGLSRMKAEGEIDGRRFLLSPVTETSKAQGDGDYKGMRLYFPATLGTRLVITRNFRIGLEAFGNFYLSDYVQNSSAIVNKENPNDVRGLVQFQEQNLNPADGAVDADVLPGKQIILGVQLTLAYRIRIR